MKVLLVGDTHRSMYFMKEVFDTAEQLGCDRIFQLGDFGFWPKSDLGNKYLTYVNDESGNRGLPLYFLGGNHEDWNDLDYVFATYLTDSDGFHKYGNIRIAPRSNVWSWDDMTFANMSGAFSIDKKYRTENIDWFPQELPTRSDLKVLEELLELKGLNEVDVLLAHDAPVNLFAHQGKHSEVFVHADADRAQDMMADAMRLVNPSVLVHGHWHMYYEYYYGHTWCLALDQMTRVTSSVQCATLDTETRTICTIYIDETEAFYIP